MACIKAAFQESSHITSNDVPTTNNKSTFLKSTTCKFGDPKQLRFDFGMAAFIFEDNLHFNTEAREFSRLINMANLKNDYHVKYNIIETETTFVV